MVNLGTPKTHVFGIWQDCNFFGTSLTTDMKNMKNAKTQNPQFTRDTKLSKHGGQKPPTSSILQYIRL